MVPPFELQNEMRYVQAQCPAQGTVTLHDNKRLGGQSWAAKKGLKKGAFAVGLFFARGSDLESRTDCQIVCYIL